MRTCPDCLSIYKKSKAGRAARKSHGAWGHGHWPTDVYHSQPTSKCFKHHTQSLADSAARRAGIEQACPAWANRKEIKRIYEECTRMTQKTGIPHEVDHIVPLHGVNVSGLHVHWNLQVIRASKNRIKSNKF